MARAASTVAPDFRLSRFAFSSDDAEAIVRPSASSMIWH
jgi:hypothetical protein